MYNKAKNHLLENGYSETEINKIEREGRIKLFQFKCKEAGISIGQSYENKNRYEGEGEIIIGRIGSLSFPEGIDCVHACHTKHKGLNGSVQILGIETLLSSFVKI